MFRKKKSKINITQDIFINNVKISMTDKTKFLGVIIDEFLSFQPHIMYIKGKVAKGFGVLLKARKVFNQETLVALYYSMIYPYLSYCIHVWGSAYLNHLKDLVSLQKRIIRVISSVHPLTHTVLLFKSLTMITAF